MSDLQIQIVDEQDNPIGNASKQEAWRKGLKFRIVRITVIDENGRMLIQKRSEKMELYPGRWDNSAAGHVDVGEDYYKAALRELKEELGIEGYDLEDVGYYYDESINDWRIMKRFTHAYRIVLHENISKLSLQEEEVASTKWMKISEVKDLVKNHPDQVTDGLTEIINRYY